MNSTHFESIVRDHQAMVYGIAFNMSNNVALAEEIAQEVFLEFVRGRPDIRSASHLKAWLRRVATHRSIDSLRRKRARPEVQMDVLPEVAVTDGGSDPLRDARLRRLVASLPEKQRAVVILKFGEDLDVAEISDVLGVPRATVRTQLARALELMRVKMTPCAMEQR